MTKISPKITLNSVSKSYKMYFYVCKNVFSTKTRGSSCVDDF